MWTPQYKTKQTSEDVYDSVWRLLILITLSYSQVVIHPYSKCWKEYEYMLWDSKRAASKQNRLAILHPSPAWAILNFFLDSPASAASFLALGSIKTCRGQSKQNERASCRNVAGLHGKAQKRRIIKLCNDAHTFFSWQGRHDDSSSKATLHHDASSTCLL